MILSFFRCLRQFLGDSTPPPHQFEVTFIFLFEGALGLHSIRYKPSGNTFNRLDRGNWTSHYGGPTPGTVRFSLSFLWIFPSIWSFVSAENSTDIISYGRKLFSFQTTCECIMILLARYGPFNTAVGGLGQWAGHKMHLCTICCEMRCKFVSSFTSSLAKIIQN